MILENIIYVLIEYSVEYNSVSVRATSRKREKLTTMKPLEDGNIQNIVSLFEDIDHKKHVGFDLSGMFDNDQL